VFVVSDHGGGPSNDWILYMNDWLEAEGFMAIQPKASASVAKRAYAMAMRHMSVPLKRRLRPMFGKWIERAKGLALYGDVDWGRSRAYGTVQSMVRLNQVGREPTGTVRVDQREAVLSELASKARARTFPSGEPLFDSVSAADDVYAGDAPGKPDLVVEPKLGTQVRGRNTTGRAGFLFELRDLGVYYPSGEHTPTGMVVAAGTGIERQGEVPETGILQAAPSILAVMGVPAPQLDGTPFPFVTSRLMSTGEQVEIADAGGMDLDEAEEAEVLERLRGLGYVD